MKIREEVTGVQGASPHQHTFMVRPVFLWGLRELGVGRLCTTSWTLVVPPGRCQTGKVARGRAGNARPPPGPSIWSQEDGKHASQRNTVKRQNSTTHENNNKLKLTL